MKQYVLTKSERRFAELIWREEPISSGDLVRVCEDKFRWKKSTTYTVLKKLCLCQIFQNNNAVVTSVITRDEYIHRESQQFVDDAFGGSLPFFFTSFMSNKKISKEEAEELKQLIDEYEEE